MSEAHVHNFNPKYLGPGVWWVIHMTAANANTYSEKIEAKNMIENICRNFFCETCKTHFIAYLKKHPIEDVMNLNLGLFKWTVDFHNAGNLALKKSTVSLDEAKQLYIGSGSTCKTRCGEDTAYSTDEAQHRTPKIIEIANEIRHKNTTSLDREFSTVSAANPVSKVSAANPEVEKRKEKKDPDTFKVVNRRITYTADLFGIPKTEGVKIHKLPHVSTDVDSEITFVRSKKPSHRRSLPGKHDGLKNSKGHGRKITYAKF